MKHNDYQAFFKERQDTDFQIKEMTYEEFATFVMGRIKRKCLISSFQTDEEGWNYGFAIMETPMDSYCATMDYYGGGQFRAIGLDSQEDENYDWEPTDYDLIDIENFIVRYLEERHRYGQIGTTVFAHMYTSDNDITTTN